MTKTVQTLPSELWTRIEAFNIDGGDAQVAFPFHVRLAQENGWSVPFAKRVVVEYKRFVFLAMTAGHPVTPSDQVDQAWHLHLTYTRSYWQRLCGETLPKPLHHDPTRGGASEEAKFDDWYAKTKESYAKAFGEESPKDIWPDGEVRFNDDLHFKRINTLRNYVVPKRVVRVCVRMGALTCGASMLVSGCVPLTMGSGWDAAITGVVVIGLVVLVIGSVIGASVRHSKRPSSRRDSKSGAASGCGGGFWFFGGGCGSGHSNHSHSDSSGGHGGHGGHGDSGGGDSGGGGCSGGGCGGGGCGGGD